MADKKISALTAASTPLAGTEVLPIVQSGSTVKVAVSDLTAGRGVSLGGTSAVDTPYSFGGNNYGLAVTSSGNPSAYLNNEFGSGQFEFGGYYNGAGQYKATNTSYSAINIGAGTVDIYGNTGLTIGNTFARTKFGTFTGGNYVPAAAAKGINFTANTPAAGMTSQLLNWYEEGTWVPVLRFGGASTGITGTFTGTYTRVGNLVMVRGYCSVTNKGSATGAANINGLPFPVKSNTQPFAPGNIYVSGGAIAAGGGEMVQLNFNASGIDVNKVNPATGADANCTDGNFAASGSFWFSAVYDV